MIRPLPWPGAAFTLAADGDQRIPRCRQIVAGKLGISPEWATVRQVHGNRAVEATRSGVVEEADAVFTKVKGLPVAVMAADCAPVVVGGPAGVGVAHCGWRGVVAGVLSSLVDKMQSNGITPSWAAVGPFIGPCCFEVGPEVAARFPRQVSRTRIGQTSVDLGGALGEQLGDLPTWWSQRCTLHEPGCFSYRRNASSQRMAAIAWVIP
ncbi:MAG: polyphenol oxidase family protein [bacterium]|nr:polyphenol oxidase family protein [Acidimicrobiia bacterium]MCY4650602.1 polyphenol oxidase family protein [bacterium]